MVRLIALDDAAAQRWEAGIAEVYDRAFDEGTEQLATFFSDRFPRHRSYPGYQGLLALDDSDRAVGFVYGYRSAPGQPFRALIEPAAERNGRAGLMDDAFEFAELAVHPDARGLGIGGRLHDELLIERPEAVAVLSTAVGPTVARAMYDARGWEVVDPAFQNGTCVLMALDLAEFKRRQPS